MSASSAHERRRVERRRTDRRQPPKPPGEDSWFGALADGGDTVQRGDGADPSALPDAGRPSVTDSRFLAREARRIVSGEGTALHRVFRAYVTARAVIGAALVLAPWAMSMMGSRPPLALVLVCLGYASQAASMWLLGGREESGQPAAARLRRRQWVLTIGVDLVAFSALHLMETTQPLNFSALLALPVLMAGIMTKRLAALATASFVALVLLVGVWRLALQGGDPVVLFSQAGVAGIGAFVITLIASELAQRLAREERSARGSLEIARQQAQLNRLVLEEMADGVMVIDRRSRVRAANPAARAMLGVAARGVPMPFSLQGEPTWKELIESVEQAFALGGWPETSRELRLGGPTTAMRMVQARARFTRRGSIDGSDDQPEDVCVLFLEDMRHVQARVRQEKLASMGRMSAGISHEIRNPLAAIAQANALMLEDALDPSQRKLARIVEDNVLRLKRIVDDVLAVAPTEVVRPHPVDVAALVREICDDWMKGLATPAGTGAAGRVTLLLPEAAMLALFDAEHMRRVLVNLLDNANRHATQAEGSILVGLRAQHPDGIVLSIGSDGAPITPDVERHLFEPFFSTRSRGTGLGLYICRELCERYGATIDFRPGQPGDRHCNVFRVVMRPAPSP
ncbi:PAS domain-containing sensor histidine kinase [Ideonella sp. A 288]|uniref:sensor histidine kinase n=1 Tax=Ideonella sp. A 288 TaxID=1962181 RepID=UPI000B4C17EB|nr:ATP-binding protein [Ideonella sp. A 288]